MAPISSNDHWSLFIFFLNTGEIFKLSSINKASVKNENQITVRFRELFRKFNLNNNTKIKTRLKLDNFNTPQQKRNSNDCGIFVICFIETILQTQKLEQIKDFDVTGYRQYIGKLLLDYPKELEVTNTCLKCGTIELDSSVLWIKCDICLRWTHSTCITNIENINIRNSYTCFLCNFE